MQLLAPTGPRVIPGRSVDIREVAPGPGMSRGFARVDLGDPALPSASALLIERASPLTHVAIIARELGVPTVVPIDGFTSAIRTGMTVSVDGASGRVTLLEDQPEQVRSDA